MPVDAAHAATARRSPAELTWLIPFIVAGGTVLAAAKVLGGPLALPTLSVLLLAAGFLGAGAFYAFGPRARHSFERAPLLAGALVLLGFAAALLSDGDGVLLALDRIHAANIVASGN